MAFRFFINVDKCLNMNNFDFFFYKKRSRHELHLTPDVYIGEGTGLSFRKAASDIRMYLDRFPYHVDDYQIIIAMRSDYKSGAAVWRDTLLSRLLNIDFDLRQSNILIRTGLGVQIAVNLIMLYEANVVKEIHAVNNPYMVSERLADDCHLLLQEIGVPADKENDPDAVREAWNKYVESRNSYFSNCPKMEDGTPADALYVFFRDLIGQYEEDRKHYRSTSHKVSTLHALREVLNGYQIFELITDKQNRNRDINTLIKVVEFSTTDYYAAEGMDTSTSLTEKCAAHWQQIVEQDDISIQEKYAKMLSDYRDRLSRYVANSEKGYAASDMESTLPESKIPPDDDISITDSIFESENAKRSRKIDPKSIITEFKNRLFPVGTLLTRWETTYGQVSAIFSQLGDSLEEYSDLLGEKYSERLEQRKKEERTWHRKAFVEGKTTKQEIEDLFAREKTLLTKMNQPQMTPSLCFQDQLNMETALEQENQNICHYIKCIQSVSARNFFLLIILLLGFTALLYGLLQPYNFESTATALYYAEYLGICFILMLFTWRLPLNYYRRKVNHCLIKLEDEMDKYITGYFDRAKQLHEYINLINKLDYIERHIHLKKNAVNTTEWVVNARTWHRNQAKDHLLKLEFFSGLISTYKPDHTLAEPDGFSIESGPVITRDHVDDVIDNKLYWPQA